MPNNSWDRIYKREVREGYVDKKTGKYLYYDVEKPHEDLKKVVSILKKNRVKRILYLGCGAGRNLIPLVRAGFEVQGIDLSSEGLKLIRDKLGRERLRAELRVGDVFRKLPYPPGNFDAVISVQVLNHNVEKKILGTIGEITRVLKPNGMIFITLPGMFANGKMRYYYNHDSREIAPRTRMPTKGEEKGLPHFYYNKAIIRKHFKEFRSLESWKDKLDYYCFIARKK